MSASVPVQEDARKLEQLIDGAASLRLPIYRILTFCENPQPDEAVEAEFAACAQGRGMPFQISAALQWLKDAGAMKTLDADEYRPGGRRWVATALGDHLLAALEPSKRVTALLDSQPQYADSYYRMLVFCLVPRSGSEIEKHFEDDPALVSPKRLPESLTSDLETVGALEWIGKWRTTDKAREFLQ